jgi:hypothetical protein
MHILVSARIEICYTSPKLKFVILVQEHGFNY